MLVESHGELAVACGDVAVVGKALGFRGGDFFPADNGAAKRHGKVDGALSGAFEIFSTLAQEDTANARAAIERVLSMKSPFIVIVYSANDG